MSCLLIIGTIVVTHKDNAFCAMLYLSVVCGGGWIKKGKEKHSCCISFIYPFVQILSDKCRQIGYA